MAVLTRLNRTLCSARARWIAPALVVLVLALPFTAEARDGYYRSTDGSMVHGPTRGNRDYGKVTARCGDGSRSFSHHARGTCSHHGGVARRGE